MRPVRAGRVRASRLGKMLVMYRASNAVSLRTVASEIGISAATLSRIERGYALDAVTMITLWQWLLSEAA